MSKKSFELMVCKICGNARDNKSFKVREMMFGYREWFSYFQCSQCGCLQIAEIPADMSKYYPSNYYSYNESPNAQYANPLKKMLLKMRDRYAIFDQGMLGKLLYMNFPEEGLRSLSRISWLRKETRILDVGCGLGFLLYALKESGFKNLLGVDPFIHEDIEYGNGLRILKKNIDAITGEWDLVMFHHVFEHLPDPVEMLRLAAKLLSTHSESACLIRMPTVSSFAWEHYGVNWVQLDAPRHFFLHSIESLKITAEKANLQLENIAFDSTNLQFWGSEQYLRDIPFMAERSFKVNRFQSIFSRAQIAEFKKSAQRLNREGRGDMAAFYLKKNRSN